MTKAERNQRPYQSVLETIGWTPLIRLNSVTRGIRTPVYAKAEFFNPGGSVKDRPAMNMILDGEKNGKLDHSRIILDATSATRLEQSQLASLLACGVTVAVRSDTPPFPTWPWRRMGDYAVLSYTPAGPTTFCAPTPSR